MAQITEDLIFFCQSYFDSVRDVASRCLLFIGENLLTFETPFSASQLEMVQTLRATLTLGWDEKMSQPIRDCAEMEQHVSKFMFKDAGEFVRKVLTVMLDEPSQRDVLSKFMVKLNSTLPFIVMNDYRIATATNSLQRTALLARILKANN